MFGVSRPKLGSYAEVIDWSRQQALVLRPDVLHCVLAAGSDFSGCSSRGLLFIEVHRFFLAVASLATERAWALGAQASVFVAAGLSG